MNARELQLKAKKENPRLKNHKIFHGTNDLTSLLNTLKENKDSVIHDECH
jgi:hypothetical protein